MGTDLCGNRRPLPPRNPDRLAAIGTRNLTEPLVSMDRYFVSNRTWNITTLGLLYRGRVGLSAVWVLTGATYVQRLEKFLIGLWSKKKRKKSFQRGFKQFYPKRVPTRENRKGEGILCLAFSGINFYSIFFREGKEILIKLMNHVTVGMKRYMYILSLKIL